MIADFVDLDHNATTPVRAEAAAMLAETARLGGNPSSIHRLGRAARHRLEAARAEIAAAIGLPPGGTIIFTSGGTEANRLALGGIEAPRYLMSAIEHDSARAARPEAEVIPVAASGLIDLDALDRQLRASPPGTLVSIMAANNETGVIQPIAEIARLVHAAGALLHGDAIQAVGKIPFDMAALGADLVTVSAHKLGGVPGVAALALAPGVPVTALQTGGGQEKGYRAGTENLPGIAAFGCAIMLAVAELERFAALAALRDAMQARLLALDPAAVVFGAAAPRLPNTLSIALPGVTAEVQIMALDLAGIGVSAGAACSSGKLRPSHVLTAMGVPGDVAGSAIRVSLGRMSVAADIDRLVAAWGALITRTAGRRNAPCTKP
jgi:cysteine desulfurase